MLKILCLIGMFGLGFEIPELCGLMGAGKTRIPTSINVYTALSLVFIASYFLYR